MESVTTVRRFKCIVAAAVIVTCLAAVAALVVAAVMLSMIMSRDETPASGSKLSATVQGKRNNELGFARL